MAETIDPARTGLVVFDMLEAYRAPIEKAGSIEPVRRLIAGCREWQVPIFYARADHRPDGADFARTLADTDNGFRPHGADNPRRTRPSQGSGDPLLQVLSDVAPQDGDYDIPKHRWSAFHGTHLELSLRSRGIDTVLLVGGSVHVGIASTAFDARDMDFQVIVVRDGCHGFTEQREFFMDKVFPRMCRVRSVSEALQSLSASASSLPMS